MKFSPDGKLLLTLGKPGTRGNPPEALTEPTDVVTDPANGDVYVAESHTNVADPNLIGRISVFDRTGKFLRTIGKTGTGPGEFRTPHALEFDSQGRLIVADRHNHRVQILTKEGKPIAEYPEFGRTSGLAIDRNDVIYTADSESTERVHPGWQRGIRIGSLKDGKVTIFVPPHATPNSTDGAMGEGIAIDAAGNVYTAEAQLRGVTKYVEAVASGALHRRRAGMVVRPQPPRPPARHAHSPACSVHCEVVVTDGTEPKSINSRLAWRQHGYRMAATWHECLVVVDGSGRRVPCWSTRPLERDRDDG